MGYGDEILAAGQAQRMHESDKAHRKVGIYDMKGRPRWHPIWDGNPILRKPTEMISHLRLVSAPHRRPYIVYPFTAEAGWTFNRAFKAREHIAKIYLTEAELRAGRELRARIGPYILVEPFTNHPNLQWPLTHWHELVSRHPRRTYVQHIHAKSPRIGGIHRVPATFRQACGLVASAECYVRTESGMCHAAAALGVPQVTIWGGCMDWDVMGGYPKQIGVLNYTIGSPCGQWNPCNHCLQAMQAIRPDRVNAAIDEALALNAPAVAV